MFISEDKVTKIIFSILCKMKNKKYSCNDDDNLKCFSFVVLELFWLTSVSCSR